MSSVVTGWTGSGPPPPEDFFREPPLPEGLRVWCLGMWGCHTENCIPPVLGRVRVQLTNEGAALYGLLRVVYELSDEEYQPVGIAGADVPAPLPGERVEYDLPFACDAARHYRLREVRQLRR
jgi:hypothetical protein